jgi:hypothetical protein
LIVAVLFTLRKGATDLARYKPHPSNLHRTQKPLGVRIGDSSCPRTPEGAGSIRQNSTLTFLFFLFSFLVVLGFELRDSLLQSLSHTSSSFCSGYFGDGCLENHLLQLVSNLNPPDLSLLNSQVYRRQP